MKRLRMKTFLATAVAAALLVAIPASASASEWVKNGSALTENATVTISGTATRQFTNFPPSSFTCAFSSEAVLKPGSKGNLKSFSMDPKQCIGTGQLSECHMKEIILSPEAKTSPIHIGGTVEKPTIVFDKVGYRWYFQEVSCANLVAEKYLWYSGPEQVLTPSNPASISSLTLYSDVFGSEKDFTGSASMSPASVYGIK